LTDDIYLARTHRAEDKDLLPLDVQLYLTIRILNPYKAKFRIQDWLETTINRMQPLIRQHISQSDYEDLSRNLQATEEELLKKLEDGGLIQEFQIRYGVGVRKIEILKEAEGVAEAIKLVAAAKAEEIEKTFGAVESFGEQGFLLEIAKMAKEGNVPASVITHYLAGRFSKVLEDRETMTSEELRSFIKKLIEEFTQLEEAVEKL
jgi:regulator of protease activity HflC (stomatin/prohibitin superfamily)